MNFSQSLKIKFLFTPRVLGLLIAVCMFAVSAAAQKTRSFAPMPNPSANLTQCRNGTTGTDPCAGNNWVTGNVGQSNSQYAEDEYVPYRMVFDNLEFGLPGTSHVYTVIIGYDTTHGGPVAIDYLGTYDTKIINPRTTNIVVPRANVDPCGDYNGCVGPMTTIPITQDTLTVVNPLIINPNTGQPHYQPTNQVFTMWGGTLLSFDYTNFTTGQDNKREVTITFTAQVANPVLSWSGHIGWLGDWGVGNSAGGIQGSPYHMRLIELDGSGGNQDRSLSADGVTASAQVLIRKLVQTLDCRGEAVFLFPFSASAGFGSPSSFSLSDLNPNVPPDPQNPCVGFAPSPGTPQQSQSITAFGPANAITVTECTTPGITTGCAGTTFPTGWTLAQPGVNCVEDGFADSTTNGLSPTATIIVQPGETVTCTFTNTQQTPSAALVPVSGRVMTVDGRGISNARVTLTDQTGGSRTTITSSFGYYRFDDVEVGQTYVVSVSSKRYQFNSQVISLSDELTGLDFIALP